MPAILAGIFLFLVVATAASLQADERQDRTTPAPSKALDLKVIAVMDILQMLEMTEEMEMIIDLEYLIEDDQDEGRTD